MACFADRCFYNFWVDPFFDFIPPIFLFLAQIILESLYEVVGLLIELIGTYLFFSPVSPLDDNLRLFLFFPIHVGIIVHGHIVGHYGY